MNGEWNEMLNFISNTGFPMFLSVYLLNRMEKKLDGIIEALHQLSLPKN